ncbi:MAG: tripartite tricarboxylate transporter TctB family protein [Burkholderiaceae bacterium]
MRDRILGLVVVIVAVTMAWNARGMVPPFAYEPVGPRAFPWLLSALLVLFGLWLIVRPAQPSATGEAATRILPLPVLTAFGTVVAYGLLFQMLGFPIATVGLGW